MTDEHGDKRNPAAFSYPRALNTPRLSLRRLDLADAQFMLAILNDAGFLANIGDRGVRTIDEARAYIRDRIISAYTAHGFGMLRVALATTDEPIGIAGFVKRPGLDHPDLGFAFLADHTRFGYGFEATRALLDAGHPSPLLAITQPQNEGSIRLLTKLRFSDLGELILPGENRSVRLFGLS